VKDLRDTGFTLVELLVVIAIIGVIAGLLMPVIGKARQQAHRARAREDVQQVVTAWKAFLSDNRQFPNVALGDMGSNAVAILSGNDTNLNEKGLTYMEFTKAEIEGGFSDPWGRVYQMAIDNGAATNHGEAYDGKVWPQGHGEEPVRQFVAVWSSARDPDDVNDDVTSWVER